MRISDWSSDVCSSDLYGDIPLYVTENGAAFFDPPVADVDASGARRVRDPLRTDYLRKHLSAIHDAIAAGVDVRGSMVWSPMDTPEWSPGSRTITRSCVWGRVGADVRVTVAAASD